MLQETNFPLACGDHIVGDMKCVCVLAMLDFFRSLYLYLSNFHKSYSSPQRSTVIF